ncbi:F420H2 dehydrogenase subunit F [Thiorhodovibrio winogradskyi]|uniref:F420H2 dehydrogenase subunit F n=1 Tax=Thiorhodovibrio winogradskyi TaxID=77007 RepID=A0ABZ0SFD4_9GAMM|nr:Coenzyme F420 hydrogenase/dehydrogenase, beta subunit C-terminal domain [Thiorhodovibrio winogradskyi]
MTNSFHHDATAAGRLEATVIRNGYCVGCGACASIMAAPFQMKMNHHGQYEAQRIPILQSAHATIDVQTVCPFSDEALTEDQLAQPLYGDVCDRDSNAGYFFSVYSGYVAEGDFRARGSSGGFGTWIVHELFKLDLIDYVIHVQPLPPSDDNGPLFVYTISDSSDSIRDGAKSRYYPIELSSVLHSVRDRPGRYAFVGLPCFIKSVRLLQRQDPVFKERIKYCVGLVCGHLKSTRYAESLAWQIGIDPLALKSFDFRVKDDHAPADRYCVSASDGEQEMISTASDLFGTDWGAGAFKYKSCDFCDDVFSETADVVLGDAWLPQFVNDSKGTNILIIRNPDIHKLLDTASKCGRIDVQELPIALAVASQAGGLRHRKDAIAYRLYSEKKDNCWTPRKRPAPLIFLFPRFERKRQDLRAQLRKLSHDAFDVARNKNDIAFFLDQMKPLYREYRAINGDILGRIISLARRKLRQIP